MFLGVPVHLVRFFILIRRIIIHRHVVSLYIKVVFKCTKCTGGASVIRPRLLLFPYAEEFPLLASCLILLNLQALLKKPPNVSEDIN